MRLFVAINFGADMVDALTEVQDRLRTHGVEGNFTCAENIHLTLAFMEDYGNPQDILDAMEAIPFEQFLIRLSGIRHYRDLCYAFIADCPELVKYTRNLRRELANRSIRYDRKKFSPHITLARKVTFKAGVIDPVEALPECEETIRRVSLIRSERGRRGMVYTEIGGTGEF